MVLFLKRTKKGLRQSHSGFQGKNKPMQQTTLQFKSKKKKKNSHYYIKDLCSNQCVSHVLHLEENIICIFIYTQVVKKKKRAKKEIKPNCTLLHPLLLEAVTFF